MTSHDPTQTEGWSYGEDADRTQGDIVSYAGITWTRA